MCPASPGAAGTVPLCGVSACKLHLLGQGPLLGEQCGLRFSSSPWPGAPVQDTPSEPCYQPASASVFSCICSSGENPSIV